MQVHCRTGQFRADPRPPRLRENAPLGEKERFHIVLVFVGSLKRWRDQREEQGRKANGSQQPLLHKRGGR